MSNELMIHQTLIEVSSTEAWIDISIPAPTKTIPVIMKRNGIPIRDFQLNTRTVFSDSGLTPGERYDYQVFSEDIQISPIVSNLVSATTLDTTSHDIHWTVYQFGNAPSSSLNDIWIDNDIIFAGGKIWQGNFQDTSQNVLDQFSGVYGNNQTLDLLQIIYQFPSYKSILNIYGIWKNNTGSYWLTAGNIYKWDGTDNIELSYQRDISTSQIALVLWGLSDSLMYSGGTEGLLLKYQHNRWTNLNMNSDSYFTDIWGCVDEEYRAPIVYATIWSPEIGSVNELLRIYPDNSVGIIDLRPFVNEVVPYSVWFKNKNIIYVAGNRLFRRNPENQWKIMNRFDDYFISKVRGLNHNDVFAISETGTIFHFNGNTWKEFLPKPDIFLQSLFLTENKIIVVGYDAVYAYLIKGVR